MLLILLWASSNNANSTEYERSLFGSGWADIDRDCQNTRAELLIEMSTIPVDYTKSNSCVAKRGRWISVFTGDIITNASKIDIDHVVPLKWAWDNGADTWSKKKRVNFANANINLIPVEASLNRSKGAKGMQEWLPPKNKCEYITRFTRVLKTFELPVTRTDKKLLKQYCD